MSSAFDGSLQVSSIWVTEKLVSASQHPRPSCPSDCSTRLGLNVEHLVEALLNDVCGGGGKNKPAQTAGDFGAT